MEDSKKWECYCMLETVNHYGRKMHSNIISRQEMWGKFSQFQATLDVCSYQVVHPCWYWVISSLCIKLLHLKDITTKQDWHWGLADNTDERKVRNSNPNPVYYISAGVYEHVKFPKVPEGFLCKSTHSRQQKIMFAKFLMHLGTQV